MVSVVGATCAREKSSSGWLVVDLGYGRGGITGLAGVVAGLHAVVHGHFCGGEDALWCFVESAFFVLFLHR